MTCYHLCLRLQGIVAGTRVWQISNSTTMPSLKCLPVRYLHIRHQCHKNVEVSKIITRAVSNATNRSSLQRVAEPLALPLKSDNIAT